MRLKPLRGKMAILSTTIGAAAVMAAMSLPWDGAPVAKAAGRKRAAKPATAVEAVPARAIWLWGSYVYKEGAENVAARLAKYKFNKVILLVKGGGGDVPFKSAAKNAQRDIDMLQETVAACHKRGIEVHAWLMFHGDARWASDHPEDATYNAGRGKEWDKGPQPVKGDKICPLAEGYRRHFKQLVGDLLDNYDIDGIHLDGIRYSHNVYCFCPRHQQKAKELGINLEHVRQLVFQSHYADKPVREAYVHAYKRGDQDVVKWVRQRQDEITSMVREVREIIQKKKPQAKLSEALMPEGGEKDDAFALCYYGQNYREIGKYSDFLCPMSYEGSFGRKSDWVVRIAKHSEEETGKPTYAGIQGFPVEGKGRLFTATDFAATLKAVEANRLSGFVIFRYGSMSDKMWDALEGE